MKKILSFICVCSTVFVTTACSSQGSASDTGMSVPASSQETGKAAQQTDLLQNDSENASVTKKAG